VERQEPLRVRQAVVAGLEPVVGRRPGPLDQQRGRAEWALLSDDEIAEARGAIMASIGPDEAAYTVECAGEALNPQELLILQGAAASRS